ncbi:hypothetical protein NC651_011645 [Populus alba x Populus x berolinensis]|nr:hypothetical protein NC651_011645 [Populus alba x Populus x berolinensis]
MEVVGEVFLSALLEPLLGKLTSGDLLNFVRKTQVEKELNKWKQRLSEIDAVLKDAEEKPITSSSVKIWLTKLRDLAYDLDDTKKEPCSVESYAAVRHSSFTSHRHDISQRFDVFYEMKNLRTFLALPTYSSQFSRYHLSSKVLDDLVPKLKCLRALSLAGYSVEELPNSTGTLKRLRYLNLSYTWIKRLPESLGELFNLQTLRLRGCRMLVELPTCVVNLINLQCLDIRDTYGLQEMPPQISKLINLRMLPKFIVGEGKGLGITELMKLSHLQGQLKIEGLQKVNVRDAELANLKEKTGLCDLALQWISNFDDPLRNERIELHVLDSLKPHRSLEKLSVTSYGGTEFPSWIGDSCYSKMVDLKLLTCRKITSLSSVGKLPALRHLRIEGMDGVKEVYAEDFQSLETLYIGDMLGWERWFWSDGVNESTLGKFPKLSELTLINCPRLIGDLPSCLPSLKKLHIKKCQGVVLTLRAAPDLTSLASLSLIQISGLVSLQEELVQALVALEDLDLVRCNELTYLWQDGVDLDKLSSLKRLRIYQCEQLVSLVEGEEGILPCNLEVLTVEGCSNLGKLANGLSSLTSLRDLTIIGSRKLECFYEGAGLPLSLKRLVISGCDSLRSLPDGMMTMVNDSDCNQCLLETLSVRDCPSLKWLPKGKLPKTLKSLYISWGNQESLPEGILQRDARETSRSNLEHLTLWSLSATSFPTGEFPISLKKLDIFYCRIPSLPPLHFLFHLTELRIYWCNELKSFPKGGLPLPNLISLLIDRCEKLRSLPSHMDSLKSLQHLRISHCHRLDSLPERGLPPNLTSLEISSCKITLPVSEWGLRMLTSLKRFSVQSTIDVDRFPDDEGLLLPTSLTCLEISNLENLKSISRGLQHLTSLEELDISECPILQFFPREGFPLSLGYLRIHSSPLLKERCLKEREYWPIIAHIPKVVISFIIFNIQVTETYRHSIILGCNSVSDVHLCGQTVLYKPVQRPNERLHLKSVVIPRQLCDNAGFDATDVLNKPRQKHALPSGEGAPYGVDINTGGIADSFSNFVWEPSVVKINAINAATEAACLILSVDETVKNPKSESAQGEAAAGAMGGRGGGGFRGRGRGMRRR